LKAAVDKAEEERTHEKETSRDLTAKAAAVGERERVVAGAYTRPLHCST